MSIRTGRSSRKITSTWDCGWINPQGRSGKTSPPTSRKIKKKRPWPQAGKATKSPSGALVSMMKFQPEEQEKQHHDRSTRRQEKGLYQDRQRDDQGRDQRRDRPRPG